MVTRRRAPEEDALPGPGEEGVLLRPDDDEYDNDEDDDEHKDKEVDDEVDG